MSKLSLSPQQADWLTEFLAIGCQEIKSRLRLLLNGSVSLDTPKWELCEKDQVPEFVNRMGKVAAIVEQEFKGKYSGRGFVILKSKSAQEISSLILQEPVPASTKLTVDQKDALKELGNIIINGLICTADNFLGDQHEFLIPTLFLGIPHSLINVYQFQEDSFPILVLNTFMQVRDRKMEASIGILVEKNGIQTLISQLDKKFSPNAKAA